MKKLIGLILLIESFGNIFAQTPPYEIFIDGNQADALYGSSLSAAGDINGDGFQDLVVGAYNFDGPEVNEGKIDIYLGSPVGLSLTPAATIEGNQASAQFGFAVANAGDVNNDGFSDIIVGAPNYDNGETNEGRVYIYHGSAAGIIATPATILESNQASAYYGGSVSGANDVNADGYDDVIIGSRLYDNGQTNEGRAYFYLGSPSGIITTPNAILESNQTNAEFGNEVCELGDVNNDGFNDVAVASNKFDNGSTDEGRVFIFHGKASGLNTIANTTLESNKYNAQFGNSIAGSGDVNNDGFNDIIIGASEYSNENELEGAAFVYHGSISGIISTPSIIIQGNQYGANFGTGVCCNGDINNDGFNDIIVSATIDNDQFNEGKLFVFPGTATGVKGSPLFTFETDYSTNYYGKYVTFFNDINGDEFSDIFVGAPYHDNPEHDEGAIIGYFGPGCIATAYFKDSDTDGFGSIKDSIVVCSPVTGFVVDNSDCNDLDSFQNPNSIWYLDADADSFFTGTGFPVMQCTSPSPIYYLHEIIGSGDCDDLNYAVFPEAIELLDGIDNNCNGLLDESLNYINGIEIQGNQTGANLGYSIASAGDVNGDGYDDALISAYKYDNGQTDEGLVYVHYGGISGLNSTPDLILESNQVGANFGNEVASAGDVNADGYDDILIASYKYDGGQFDEGRVFIYHGSPDGLISTPALFLEINVASVYLGRSLSSAGDVNNDGYDDIIVSRSPGVKIYYGSESGILPLSGVSLFFPGSSSLVGDELRPAGDINGDGFDDIIVGDYAYENDINNEGAVYVFFGSISGINTTPEIILEGNSEYAWFGHSMTAGDLNGDSFSDITIGAYTWDNAGPTYHDEGRVFVYYGSSDGLTLEPNLILYNFQINALFGENVTSIGDINYDGFDDIAISATTYDYVLENLGRVNIYLGSSSGLIVEPYITLYGNQMDANFGSSISNKGDYNGDNYDDFIIGSYQYDGGMTDEGKVNVFYSVPLCDLDTFYLDFDDDGYGNPLIYSTDCEAPIGYIIDNTDCNDDNELINIDVFELCNSLDDNCNGLIDDGITETISITAGGPISFCQGGSVLLTATYSGASVQWKKNGTNIPGATSATYNVSTKGNYSCVTTSACGTAESTPIFVNVIKNPNASISAGGPTTFCAGGSVVLTEIAVAGCTYQWYKGASPIAGATALTYTATTSGNYKCRVTKAATGCYKNSNAIAVIVPCREDSKMSDINPVVTIYPNPASEFIHITINLSTIKNSYFKITDITGEIISSYKITSSPMDINISNYAEGIYFISGNFEGFNFATKFIKIK